MLPDVLEQNLKVVFCGTAVGTKSAERQAYYAGPGNKFWKILHNVGLTPHTLQPEEYHTLPKYRLGLTDLVKRKSGMDADLESNDFDIASFEEKILMFSPQIVCFNGKKAAKEFLSVKKVGYAFLDEKIGGTRLFVAPSTSGAANGYWDDKHWIHLSRAFK